MQFMVHEAEHNHMHGRNRRLGISGKENLMKLRFWNRSFLLRIHFHELRIIRIYTIMVQTKAHNTVVKPNTLAQRIRTHYKGVPRSFGGGRSREGTRFNEILTNNEKNNPVSHTDHPPPTF